MQVQLLNGTLDVATAVQLSSPLGFDCFVQGKKLRAKITGFEKQGVRFRYHVQFNDGHSGLFAVAENGTESGGLFVSPYETAIADDLRAINGFLPSKPPFVLRIRSDREAFNVWVVPYRSRENYFSVFYKGSHRFDLRKTNRWEAREVEEEGAMNQEIAALVCRHIEKRQMQLQLF